MIPSELTRPKTRISCVCLEVLDAMRCARHFSHVHVLGFQFEAVPDPVGSGQPSIGSEMEFLEAFAECVVCHEPLSLSGWYGTRAVVELR